MEYHLFHVAFHNFDFIEKRSDLSNNLIVLMITWGWNILIGQSIFTNKNSGTSLYTFCLNDLIICFPPTIYHLKLIKAMFIQHLLFFTFWSSSQSMK